MCAKKIKIQSKKAVKIVLKTIDNKELVDTAKFLQTSWKKIGVDTEIQVVDRKDLNNIVKDRDFESLLFGYSIKNEKDYYSFFSSKERNYPKLNISNYTSKQTDKILDVLSGENSESRVQDLVHQLSVEIADDNPIIILYKPEFVFAHFLPYQIKLPNTINDESDRYAYVEYWYTSTEKVFSIFKDSETIAKTIDRLDTLLY
jgi:ABC-type transport system substrate-binding protein